MWRYRGQQRPPFARAPRPGEESVWDYPRPPAVRDEPRHIVVKAGRDVLADSHAALRIMETASPPTVYVPRKDVDVERLIAAAGRSVCEWKGAASYWALRDAASAPVIAWSYPDPTPDYAMLAEHYCFYPGRVACFADGERVRPQPGEFYGGWVTDGLVGPFKGEPGTGHW